MKRRVEGAVLGAAIGDLLGRPVELVRSLEQIGNAVTRARAGAGEPPESVLTRYLGWAAHDAAAYVFTRHPDDPRAALLEAVNSPGDSDSIGTLVGALVGARCGLAALPASWVEEIERGTELLALAGEAAVLSGSMRDPART